MPKSIQTLPLWISPAGISEMVKINTRDTRQSKYAIIAVEKSLSDQDNQRQETNLAIGQSLIAKANSKDSTWR